MTNLMLKMKLNITRTNSKNHDFINLVKELDAYLKITDEEEHGCYNEFNHITVLKELVVTYVDGIAIGCAAIKKFDNNTVEAKKMFVSEDNREVVLRKNYCMN